jgi:hypothetical protein
LTSTGGADNRSHMKSESVRSSAGESASTSITAEQSTQSAVNQEEVAAKASAMTETALPATKRARDDITGAQGPNLKTSANSPPTPSQKSKGTPTPAIAGKAESSATPVAQKAPLPPVEAQPSLPLSMVKRPHSGASVSRSTLFPGELEETFESALARVRLRHARNSLVGRLFGSIFHLILPAPAGSGEPRDVERNVAFDGFRNDMFEEKRERERRYGTVYAVSEEVNAFIVRLELPRRMPKSSLKQTWEMSDEMPDYAFVLNLIDNVLYIRAGLPDEARRRLSYVSTSFPSDFQTRIEFHVAVEGYKHRLVNKVLEIIVYKRQESARQDDC